MTWEFLTQAPAHGDDRGRHLPGHRRYAVARRSGRRCSRCPSASWPVSTSPSTRRRNLRHAHDPARDHQHGGRAVDRLRAVRRCAVRDPDGSGPLDHRRRAHARVPHATGGHHRNRGGSAADPHRPAPCVARAWARPSLRTITQGDPAGGRSGHHHGIDPRPVPGAGETAPILFTAVAFFAPIASSPFDETMALPYHIYIMATSVDQSRAEHGLGHARSCSWLAVSIINVDRRGMAIATEEEGQMVEASTGLVRPRRRLGRVRTRDGCRRRHHAHPRARGHGAHRTVGVRQVDAVSAASIA